jgi:ATP-dependent Clp protease ATP-binding subunit ClpC
MLYDPFTDRARKVMGYARQEAQRFNHDYIGAERLLLGLLRENEGVAAHALMNHGAKIEAVREEVRRVLSLDRAQAVSGGLTEAREFKESQDARTQCHTGTWSFSDSAVEILALAQDEGRRFGQDRIGSEHLLLALLKKELDNLTLALEELPVQPKVRYDKIRLKLAAGKTPAEPEHQTGD